MKQTTLALIAALAAGTGFAAGSGSLGCTHEGREIAGYTDRASYGTIERKLSDSFSIYAVGSDEQTIAMGPDGYILKSGPCTLIHTEKRGSCENILLWEDDLFKNGTGEWVDGNCDGVPEAVPDFAEPEYYDYPCDPKRMVREEVKNEKGEWVLPTPETHPEFCKPKKRSTQELRELLGPIYDLTTRGALGIEQVTDLWKQAVEQQVCAEGEK